MTPTAIQAAHGGRINFKAQQMSKWVDHVLGPSFSRYCPGETWQPAINLYEDRSSYCLVADLAGVQAEAIDLRVEGDLMFFSGARATPKAPEADEPVRVHLMEIDSGRFCRKVDLPDDADRNSVSATYRGGYLWIKIPKKR